MNVSYNAITGYEYSNTPPTVVYRDAVLYRNKRVQPKKRQGSVILYYVEYDDLINRAERSPHLTLPRHRNVSGFLGEN